MPRPGPRPYECLRRAWHSERHQPMRGNIIQQIFRLVSEFHSSVTKNNREWQEKLPAVVFKAEEIMYSKANSEEEYCNLDTLSDRVNNAVNLIIRRDETTETGDFLPPCVEAALNLGCIPVKASRSQRHTTPSCYLGHGIQNHPFPAPPSNLHFPFLDQLPQLQQYSLEGMPDFRYFVSEFGQPMMNDSLPCASAYPRQCSIASLSGSVLTGVPIVNHVPEKAVLKNFFGSDESEKSADCCSSQMGEKAARHECDLSLRLGPYSEEYMSVESFCLGGGNNEEDSCSFGMKD